MHAKVTKFIPIAQSIAALSKDRSTKVGAVVLGPGMEIRSTGYNGFARGINDDVEARHQRPAKYKWAAHAEENAIAQAARSGVALEGCTLVVTNLFPCTTCARLIIQSGITTVFAPKQNLNPGGRAAEITAVWEEEARISAEMFAEAGVTVVHFE